MMDLEYRIYMLTRTTLSLKSLFDALDETQEVSVRFCDKEIAKCTKSDAYGNLKVAARDLWSLDADKILASNIMSVKIEDDLLITNIDYFDRVEQKEITLEGLVNAVKKVCIHRGRLKSIYIKDEEIRYPNRKVGDICVMNSMVHACFR